MNESIDSMATQTPPSADPAPAASATPNVYAGFWKRFIAAVIDGFVLMFINSALFYILNLTGVVSPTEAGASAPMATQQTVSLVLFLIYYVSMEASHYQGTLGKMALSLRVTDVNGLQLTALRALGRNAAKFLSTLILFIGYLMVAFTPKKQGLHDIVAGTLVVTK